jgi:cephalosporin hydroxylase
MIYQNRITVKEANDSIHMAKEMQCLLGEGLFQAPGKKQHISMEEGQTDRLFLAALLIRLQSSVSRVFLFLDSRHHDRFCFANMFAYSFD